MSLLKKEIRRLKRLYEYHRGNHRDTGNQRNFNLLNRYEDKIAELQRIQERFRENVNVEQNFWLQLADIQKFVANLRKSAPDDDNLLSVELFLEDNRRRWGRL